MVVERPVLLRVEHFQKRCGRIATIVLAELVDFIEEDDGIDRLGATHRLKDSSRHRPDIGPAMPADLGFVPHPAE